MSRALRIAGTVLAAAGLLAAAWAFTVWQWQDPFTALYTAHQQESLETEYVREEARYRRSRQPWQPGATSCGASAAPPSDTESNSSEATPSAGSRCHASASKPSSSRAPTAQR